MLAILVGWERNLYLDEQAEGAWIGLGILALWIGRRHLRQVLARGIRRKRPLDDSEEPLPYGWALGGSIAGTLFLAVFVHRAGASLWALLLFFSIYFCMAIALTKVRAGLGPPMHEVIGKDPLRTMVSAVGTRTLGGKNLTILTFFYWLNRVNVAHPMPNQMEVFHIGHQNRINSRGLLMAMLLSLAIGIPIAFLIYFSEAYRLGVDRTPGSVGIAWETFNRLQSWLSYPTEPNYAAFVAMGAGFGFTMFLTAMKMRFIWWPFHPIGYVIGTGVWGDMSFIWLPVFLSWALKFGILRYGGLQAYRRAVPFFAGLILGDYTVGCIWSLLGIAFKVTTYTLWI